MTATEDNTYDVFVSYAHKDNGPLPPSEQGWITRFHEALTTMLRGRVREPRIWRDTELKGNHVFAQEITDRFATSSVLISVVTQNYVDSEWCKREVEGFCARAAEAGGLVVANKSRVFKVVKRPPESMAALPEVVRECLGYEFYIQKGSAIQELDPAYGKEVAAEYLAQMDRLAEDLTYLWHQMQRDGAGGAAAGAASPVTTVYLAQCSHDMRTTRDRIEAELKNHGCTVLPDRTLPLEDEVEYGRQVAAALERSGLAVHLIGSSYGAVPDGPTLESAAMLQNRLAAQRSRDGALRRLIWLPDGTQSEQEEQQKFIRALHEDKDVQFGADLITGDLEELKTAIHATLKRLAAKDSAQADAAAAGGDAAQRLVYVICVEADRKASVPLRKHLKEAGLDWKIPLFEGGAAEVREKHQQSLATADAVVVFYGAGDEAWKRTVDSDLKKIAGYRDGRPLLAQCTYLAAPMTADKQDLVDMEEAGLVQGTDDFDPAAMTVFLQSVLPEAGAP